MTIYYYLALFCIMAVGPSVTMPITPANNPTESSSLPPFTLPMDDLNPEARAANISYKRTNFIYGPAIGGGPSFPAGSLGNATAAQDNANLEADLTVLAPSWRDDEDTAIADVSNVIQF